MNKSGRESNKKHRHNNHEHDEDARDSRVIGFFVRSNVVFHESLTRDENIRFPKQGPSTAATPYTRQQRRHWAWPREW